MTITDRIRWLKAHPYGVYSCKEYKTDDRHYWYHKLEFSAPHGTMSRLGYTFMDLAISVDGYLTMNVFRDTALVGVAFAEDISPPHILEESQCQTASRPNQGPTFQP